MKRGYQRTRDSLGRLIYVYQYRHPVTGVRERFRGSQVECDAQRARVEDARRRLKNGDRVTAVARDFCPPDMLTLRHVFQQYMSSLSARARVAADRCWRTTINTPVDGERTLGDYRIGELTAPVMSRWALRLAMVGGRMGNGRAQATIQLAVDYCSSAIRRMGTTPAWSGWRVPPGTQAMPRPWLRSLAELERLLRAAAEADQRAWDAGRYSAHWYLAAFAALTGLRNAELAGLGWDCIELDDGPPRMVVRYQAPRGWTGERPLVAPKGGHILRQLLHPTAAEVLRRQREQLDSLGWDIDTGPVWPAADGSWRRNGRALEPAQVRRWARLAGLPRWQDWCVHSLRHSFCSFEVAAARGDLAAAARRTGHRDLRALLIYVHELGDGLGASPLPELDVAALLLPPAQAITAK